MAFGRSRLGILPLLAGTLAVALVPTPGLASGRGRRPVKAPGAGSPAAESREPAADEPWPDLAALAERIRLDRLLARPCPRVVGRLTIGAGGDLAPAPGGGMAIRPGAQLAGRNLRGLLLGRAHLKGADLRGADLRGAWLVDADLAEADLTGADLRGAVLTGARLDGARLFMADLRGAVGLDARSAQVHPFLDPEPGAPVGALRWLLTQERLETPVSAAPRNPVRAGNGGLYWIAGHRQGLLHLMSTGHIASFERPGDTPSAASRTRCHALAPDGAGGLWQFEDQGPRHYPASGLTVAGFKEGDGFTLDLDGKAPHAVALGPGRAVLTFEHEALFVGLGAGSYTHRALECPGGYAFTGSCPGWEGRQLFTAAGLDAILDMPTDRLDQPGAEVVPGLLPLPAGGQPLRMAKGPGDRVWVTVQDPAGLAVLGPGPKDRAWHPLPRTEPGPEGDLPIERGPRPIFDLALGPDGNLWFTEPTAGRIGRITPDGMITEFLLPPGFRPLEIAPLDRETLVFTVEGLNLIGSIRAVPSGQAGTTEAAAAGTGGSTTVAAVPGERKAGGAPGDGKAADATPGDAKAGSRERKRSARRKPTAADVALARFEDPSLRQPAAAQPGPAEETKAPAREIFLSLREHAARVAGRRETKPAGIQAAARRALADPDAYLRAQDIILTDERMDHILDGHGHDAETDGGRFLEAHCQPGALKALLAQGIADAGGLGPTYDAYGSRYTYCRTGQAGFYRSRGAWHGTDRFVVITWREWNPARGVHEHRIKTAFPCSGNY